MFANCTDAEKRCVVGGAVFFRHKAPFAKSQTQNLKLHSQKLPNRDGIHSSLKGAGCSFQRDAQF